MNISRKSIFLLSGVGLIVIALAFIYFSNPGESSELGPSLDENVGNEISDTSSNDPQPVEEEMLEVDLGENPALNLSQRPNIEWVYPDEYRITVELKITSESSLALQGPCINCAITKITLKKSSGEVLGISENIEHLLDDKQRQSYYISETFDHNLEVALGKTQEFVLDLVLSGGDQISLPFEIQPSEGFTLFPAQVVTSNNITAELVSIEVNNWSIISEICFDGFPIGDWFPSRMHIEGKTLTGASTSKEEYDADHRCYKFVLENYQGFEFAPNEDITLVIDKIVSGTRQVSPELVELANQRSELEGVRFKVINGDHSFRLEIVSKPAGMSNEDAERIAMESIPERIEGPWSFTVKLH